MEAFRVGDIVEDKFCHKKQIIIKLITTDRVGTLLFDEHLHTYWNEWYTYQIEKTGDFFHIQPLLDKIGE